MCLCRQGPEISPLERPSVGGVRPLLPSCTAQCTRSSPRAALRSVFPALNSAPPPLSRNETHIRGHGGQLFVSQPKFIVHILCEKYNGSTEGFALVSMYRVPGAPRFKLRIFRTAAARCAVTGVISTACFSVANCLQFSHNNNQDIQISAQQQNWQDMSATWCCKLCIPGRETPPPRGALCLQRLVGSSRLPGRRTAGRLLADHCEDSTQHCICGGHGEAAWAVHWC
jgi:hypothetical protein